MVRLNHKDNQGVRNRLLPTQLALGRMRQARRLLERYEQYRYCEAATGWGYVLERLLLGDCPSACEWFQRCRDLYPHTEGIILGKEEPPAPAVMYYTTGSLEESIMYGREMRLGWHRHPQAMMWLAQHAQHCPAHRKG